MALHILILFVPRYGGLLILDLVRVDDNLPIFILGGAVYINHSILGILHIGNDVIPFILVLSQ